MSNRLEDFFIVVVSGDRYWHATGEVDRELAAIIKQRDKVLVISGGASGIDTVTKYVCEKNGYIFAEVPAPYEFFKKKAGPIRNAWMLLFKPDLVLCFHQRIEKSKGTKNMKQLAEKAGIPVKLIDK